MQASAAFNQSISTHCMLRSWHPSMLNDSLLFVGSRRNHYDAAAVLALRTTTQ